MLTKLSAAPFSNSGCSRRGKPRSPNGTEKDCAIQTISLRCPRTCLDIAAWSAAISDGEYAKDDHRPTHVGVCVSSGPTISTSTTTTNLGSLLHGENGAGWWIQVRTPGPLRDVVPRRVTIPTRQRGGGQTGVLREEKGYRTECPAAQQKREATTVLPNCCWQLLLLQLISRTPFWVVQPSKQVGCVS